MARHLETEIDKIKQKLLAIGSQVETMLGKAVDSVEALDSSVVKWSREQDDQVDQLEVELEEDCLKLLALYQPVAIDLRFVVAALKINNDLERIGDLAVNIAQLARYLADEEPVKAPFKFSEMSAKVRVLLKNSLDSLVQMDSKLAHQVCLDDDEVDSFHRKMYTKVYSAIENSPSRVKAFVHYLSISRHLERIADYTTNIAEDVVYMVEGEIIRHQPGKFDSLSG